MKTIKTKVFLVSAVLYCVFHVITTFSYNMPINPISHKSASVINNYMEPLFSQNWHLFAPNPISTNNHVLVRGTFTNDDGEISTTEWLNLSKKYIDKYQSNRLDPYRPHLSAIRAAETEITTQTFKNPEYYKKPSNLKSDININIIRKISLMELYKDYANVQFDSIDIKISIEEFPEYGKKGESKFLNVNINEISL